MDSTPKRALIAGAGIGGLTAAIALKQAGYQVLVLEKAKKLQAVGAGITIQMNAMAALNKIGLCGDIQHNGNTIETGQIQAATGKCLSCVPFNRITAATGFPFVAIHRGRLQEVLLNTLGEQHLLTDAEVVQIEERNQRVRLWLRDDRSVTGDLLIGADGIHSSVREHLWGAAPQRYSGYAAWRGLCQNPPPNGSSEFVEIWGTQQVFGYGAIDAETCYWFATKRTQPGCRDNGDPRGEILQRFAEMPAAALSLIESTPPNRILYNEIFDRPPLKVWGRGCITLLGDAAHPMTPNLGRVAAKPSKTQSSWPIRSAFVVTSSLSYGATSLVDTPGQNASLTTRE